MNSNPVNTVQQESSTNKMKAVCIWPQPKNQFIGIEPNNLFNRQDKQIKRIQKTIKIVKKPESILKRLRMQVPISFCHVHNVLNIIGLNQESLRSKNYEESYFKSMFYIKTVEKVELRKHAIIIQLKTTDQETTSLDYVIKRFKSFGEQHFYDIACQLEKVSSKFKRQNFVSKLMKSFDGEPLSRFVDSMRDQTYMCKVAPNKLVISRKLLQLLGEEPQTYALQLSKYKMPMRQIISSESYSLIINKSIENLNLICDYLNNDITVDQLHSESSVTFTDYLYNRHHKKIYCDLILFMPTPQMSCIQVREVLGQSDELKPRCLKTLQNRKLMDQQCQQHRYKEVEILKNIIQIPDALIKCNKRQIASYQLINNQENMVK